MFHLAVAKLKVNIKNKQKRCKTTRDLMVPCRLTHTRQAFPQSSTTLTIAGSRLMGILSSARSKFPYTTIGRVICAAGSLGQAGRLSVRCTVAQRPSINVKHKVLHCTVHTLRPNPTFMMWPSD